jgi:hypothetical protein
VTDTTLRIDLTYANAYFEGAMAGDGNSFDGNWNQGAALPLTVTKQ